jgi:hypothetical protein
MVRERGGPKEASCGTSRDSTSGSLKHVSRKESSAADRRASLDDPGVPQEARKEEMRVIPLTRGQERTQAATNARWEKRSAAERFWSKVERAFGANCWQWLGATFVSGYGAFRVDGETLEAHRLAWELRYGQIPPRQCVCHHCDNRGCCNPSHLFVDVDDRAGNNHDMISKGRDRLRGEEHGNGQIDLDRCFVDASSSFGGN